MKKNIKIGIVVSEFNKEITGGLLRCCQNELRKQGVIDKNVTVVSIPGAYELPFMAAKLARTKKFHAVICLGCIIKGETSHDVHIAAWASVGIGMASLQHKIPILFGVLTPNNEAQAKKRARPGPLDRGKEVARAALRMIDLSATKRR